MICQKVYFIYRLYWCSNCFMWDHFFSLVVLAECLFDCSRLAAASGRTKGNMFITAKFALLKAPKNVNNQGKQGGNCSNIIKIVQITKIFQGFTSIFQIRLFAHDHDLGTRLKYQKKRISFLPHFSLLLFTIPQQNSIVMELMVILIIIIFCALYLLNKVNECQK